MSISDILCTLRVEPFFGTGQMDILAACNAGLERRMDALEGAGEGE